MENVYQQKEQCIEPVEAFYVNVRCDQCNRSQYQALHITEGVKFSDLEMFRNVVIYINETTHNINDTYDFTPADWSTYYYVNGCTADSLLLDKSVPQEERFYNILDTMEYGSDNKHVSLLYLGKKKVQQMDEHGEIVKDENDESVWIEIPVYFSLLIDDDEIA